MLPLVGLGRPPFERKGGTEVKRQPNLLHCSVSTARTMPSEKMVRMGDKAKPLVAYRRRLCCLSNQRKRDVINMSLVARCGYIALGGSSDVLALALDGADRLRHHHQPNQHRARRQAAVPRLVGSHCRQSDLRRTVGVAQYCVTLTLALVPGAEVSRM